jgi:dUTP pyrophosphatase
MLLVQKLGPDAILPTVANEGEDLGYDLYAAEERIVNELHTLVSTQIAACYVGEPGMKYGLIIKDRSSLGMDGFKTHAGVIDAGYRGEIKVMISHVDYGLIRKGQKVAQMIPQPVMTDGVLEVAKLPDSGRGERGFGSSGR